MSDATRILLVEDLRSDAELICREIRQALPDAEFLVVETRTAFLDALGSFLPDLILSDFKLPSFDGLSALKLAREHAPEVPFIIVTASMNEDTAVECMKAGAWDYVLKERVRRLGPAVHIALTQGRVRREQRSAERELREREQMFRDLFEHHAAVKLLIDPETGRIVDANRAASDYYGWTRERLREMFIHDINTLSSEEIKREMERAGTQQRVHFEFRHRRSDGSVRDVEVFSSKVVVRGRALFHSIVHDVTARKQAERSLRDQTSLLRLAGRVARLGGWCVDLTEQRVLWSDEVAAIHDMPAGYSPPVDEGIAFYAPEWRERISKVFDACARDGTPYDEEMEIITARGRRVWVRTIGEAVRNEDGAIVRVHGAFQDISEQIRLAEQLVQSQKLESVGRLAGGVAHDFNNILQAMQSLSAVMKLRSTCPETRAAVEEIEGYIRRGAELSRQLLLFSRRQKAAKRPLDLGEVVGGAGLLLRRLIPEHIRLVMDIAPEQLWVEGDSGQLEQIVMNLALNARDAMPDGGDLTVAARRENRRVVLEVTDTGCGMDEETRAHLFEPFFSTKEPGKGTGLGLAVVHGIAGQHGGSVEVESSPENGSCFRVLLPAAASPVPDA